MRGVEMGGGTVGRELRAVSESESESERLSVLRVTRVRVRDERREIFFILALMHGHLGAETDVPLTF